MSTIKHTTSSTLIVWISFFALYVGCSTPINQLYPDTYFPEDNIYRNKTIGFLLQFRGNWDLAISFREMKGAGRELAEELHQRGAELLFIGTTIEQNQVVRAIAINLNVSARTYAEKIQELNRDNVSEDLGLTAFFASGQEMVRWDYVTSGYRFVEFFFTVDTYNIRVAFWSKPSIFDRFESMYLDIISSLSLTGRF